MSAWVLNTFTKKQKFKVMHLVPTAIKPCTQSGQSICLTRRDLTHLKRTCSFLFRDRIDTFCRVSAARRFLIDSFVCWIPFFATWQVSKVLNLKWWLSLLNKTVLKLQSLLQTTNLSTFLCQHLNTSLLTLLVDDTATILLTYSSNIHHTWRGTLMKKWWPYWVWCLAEAPAPLSPFFLHLHLLIPSLSGFFLHGKPLLASSLVG